MAATSHSKQTVRTSDLTLATFLTIRGYEPRMVRGRTRNGGRPICFFDFDETDEVSALVQEFEEGRACIEPRRFYATLKETRRSAFSYLGMR